MARRLLDRQVSLLAHLTSGATIFDDNDSAARDPALQGIDRSLLRLEACFSHEKRMEKIIAVFPRTFDVLGEHKATVIRQFTQACPPDDISRLVNARQFCDFLSSSEQRNLLPPYLADVAACEFACLRVRTAIEEQDDGRENDNAPRSRKEIRRSRAVALLLCEYDVRSVFEAGARMSAPEKRKTPLAVVMRRRAGGPQICEVLPIVFEVLTALDDWTSPTALGETPAAKELIADLLDHRLIEARR